MDADRTELNDLSALKPDIVRELVQIWIDEASRIGVFPLDGRPWNPRLQIPLLPQR